MAAAFVDHPGQSPCVRRGAFPLSTAGRAVLSSSRPGSASSLGILVTEAAALKDGHNDLEQSRADVRKKEERLHEDLRPRLKSAEEAVQALQAAISRLQSVLAELAAAREDATSKVGRLTKRQLSEIKQLAKSPPELVRRTLASLWLLLHSDRFHGKSADAVRFDSTKEWQRVQRMLADDGFVARIVGFDPDCLAAAPGVPMHVAAMYLGVLVGGRPATASSAGAAGAAASPKPRALTQTTAADRANAVKAPPLELDAVTRACEPCGSLLRWERDLVLEHLERTRLREELANLECDFGLASARLARLQAEVAEAEAAIAQAKAAAAARAAALERLRAEELEAKRAARNLQKLDSLTAVEAVAAAPATPSTPPASRRPKPQPQPPPEMHKVEAEVQGTIAAIEQTLARLQVPFPASQSGVLDGDARQSLVLPKLAAAIMEQKGRLKLFLEGHRDESEAEGSDLERSLAVFEWLVTVAGCPPGVLRVGGCGASSGLGPRVVPVPIHEVVVRKGSPPSGMPPGVYFDEGAADLNAEARAVLVAIARVVVEDDLTVRIEGHSSTGESDEVAMRRAVSARDLLTAQGVSRSRVKVKSCKSLYPLARARPSANRRVEVHAV